MTNKFSGPIEAMSVELSLALERAAEHLETCRQHAAVGPDDLDQASMDARELAADIGSKYGGDERLERVLRVLTQMGL